MPAWDEMELYTNYLSIIHSPRAIGDGRIIHEFYSSRPAYINFDLVGKNGRTVYIPHETDYAQWGKYLSPEHFADILESPLIKHLMADFIREGWKFWRMSRKWVDRDTKVPFLAPFPNVHELIFPLHPDVEKPTREYNYYLIDMLKQVEASDILLTRADHASRKAEKKRKKNK